MKAIDIIHKKKEEGKPFFSFEYFPPKTEKGVENLYERLARMALMAPAWIDVTWGAGGSTSTLTLDICNAAQNFLGLESMMHMTCTNVTREQIQTSLERAKECGIKNILALRGGDYFVQVIF
jgi:methylenetetrahydrofolate reductase (NADPH)